MMDGSKVSFGFSKIKKATNLIKPVNVEKETEVEYVDSFDGERGKFSFKGTIREKEEKKPLVIPLVGTRSAYDVIKNKLNLRDGMEVDANNLNKQESLLPSSDNDVNPSLDDLATRELLQDAKKVSESGGKNDGMIIAADENKPNFKGEKESTLEDYDNVPVDDFGLALLRGMGWTPSSGIGKDQKVVAPITTKIRPKRMGLGAEGSAMVQTGADVDLKRGGHIKVLGGPYKGSFGIVEGVDGDCGRVFIKLESGEVISLSDTVISPVSQKEYDQRNNDGEPEQEKKKPIKTEKQYGINDNSKRMVKSDEDKSNRVEDRRDRENLFDKSSQRESSSKNTNERQSYGPKLPERRKDEDISRVNRKESGKYYDNNRYERKHDNRRSRSLSTSSREVKRKSRKKRRSSPSDTSSEEEEIRRKTKKKRKDRSRSKSGSPPPKHSSRKKQKSRSGKKSESSEDEKRDKRHRHKSSSVESSPRDRYSHKKMKKSRRKPDKSSPENSICKKQKKHRRRSDSSDDHRGRRKR